MEYYMQMLKWIFGLNWMNHNSLIHFVLVPEAVVNLFP